MADIGPGPPELIRKRITAEIKRLEFAIESQELELLEADERKRRVADNIEASRLSIQKQIQNLEALDKATKE